MASSTPPTDRNLPYHMQVEAAEDTDMHVTLARAIAAARNEDPAETDVRLYDYVESDALDRLYSHAADADGSWEFSFTVDDLDVTLDSDGQIHIS